ncbi:MAG: bis(5'-nucleosyl)-tetraphosphatase (symmetrical) YqeK [Clostridiales bacterium]|nr:bis(5'-nucleosyl)-tetraphosphatase (symmetrical) YqeK [Clostridiales bacterium]
MNGRYDLKKMEQKLAKHLDEDRMRHTLGVMYTAAGLAMVHGCSLEKAQVAGLLHDCAKCIPNKKKLKLCLENQIPMTEYEEKNPFILHAKLGAFLARKKYGVEDEEILEAITWHTTGKPDMSLLDKIIYLADYIEPGRDKASRLPYIRKLAFQDLDECMYQVLKDTLEYLSAGGADGIDEMTEEAYGYYREIHKKRNL